MSNATMRETGREGVMRACIDLLEAERLLTFRMNSGDRIVESKGSHYRIKGHPKGTADLLFFIGARPVWCECKAPGKGLTWEQAEFLEDRVAEGHTALVIHDPTQLQAWLKDQKKSQ